MRSPWLALLRSNCVRSLDSASFLVVAPGVSSTRPCSLGSRQEVAHSVTSNRKHGPARPLVRRIIEYPTSSPLAVGFVGIVAFDLSKNHTFAVTEPSTVCTASTAADTSTSGRPCNMPPCTVATSPPPCRSPSVETSSTSIRPTSPRPRQP